LAGGLAIAFRALYVPVFRTVAGDDNALVGTAVIDFSHTFGIIAVDDTLRAGDIGKAEDARGRKGMGDQTSHGWVVSATGQVLAINLSSVIPDYVIPAYTR
jgi:hypothetical protein